MTYLSDTDQNKLSNVLFDDGEVKRPALSLESKAHTLKCQSIVNFLATPFKGHEEQSYGFQSIIILCTL